MTMHIETVENAGEQERLAILEPLMAYNTLPHDDHLLTAASAIFAGWLAELRERGTSR